MGHTQFLQIDFVVLPLFSVAFRDSFVRSLLLDHNPYGEHVPGYMFPLFYQIVARELAPNLAIVFGHLVKGGSFFCMLEIS